MAGWHLINFAIPLVFMVGLGFFIDYISKPGVPEKEKQNL